MPIQPINTPPYYEFTTGGKYKSYVAILILGTGGTVWTAIELENTIGTITTGIAGSGAATLNSTALFDADKSVIQVTLLQPAGNSLRIDIFNANQIRIAPNEITIADACRIYVEIKQYL